MLKRLISTVAFAVLALPSSYALADSYSDTISIFKNAGQSGDFFKTAYGYAVFPTIGKGGVGIGGAFGKGRVYAKGRHVGDTSMTQVTVGFQLGGQGYSEIIFFQDERALKEFTAGNFEFGANATAVAIAAGAEARASSAGASAAASATKENAVTAGQYRGGMATFTVIKGGLMYEASIGGQKFSYKSL
jgi:lipid-binding SYLF domain-containing protein